MIHKLRHQLQILILLAIFTSEPKIPVEVIMSLLASGPKNMFICFFLLYTFLSYIF